jgi:hypothetical protein
VTNTFTSPAPVIERDRWGRPLIKQPTGKPVAYTRATTLAGAIEDLNGLMNWKVGVAMKGMAKRPDLALATAAHGDDKKKMQEIIDAALEAGGASSAATVGTALHSITERIDRGEEVGDVPIEYVADIAAYTSATETFERVHVEQMAVIDDIKVAGTPDLILRHDGRLIVGDKKTGSIDYPHKMAAQLAIYAHCQAYDQATGARTPWGEIDLDRALIIHLPAGTGTCKLVWLDIKAGWEAVQLALQVREWRKRKDLTEPFGGVSLVNIATRINTALTVRELEIIWETNQHDWNDEYTSLAVTRKQQLGAGA